MEFSVSATSEFICLFCCSCWSVLFTFFQEQEVSDHNHLALYFNLFHRHSDFETRSARGWVLLQAALCFFLKLLTFFFFMAGFGKSNLRLNLFGLKMCLICFSLWNPFAVEGECYLRLHFLVSFDGLTCISCVPQRVSAASGRTFLVSSSFWPGFPCRIYL